MARLTLVYSNLPKTLALRIQYLRQEMDLTQRQLAKKAYLPETLIEDVESGIELFLAPAVRLKLARALRIRADIIEEVERRPQHDAASNEAAQWKKEQATKILLEAILASPERDYQCPECQSPILIRSFDRRDMRDQPVLSVKVDCTQCLFRWSTD